VRTRHRIIFALVLSYVVAAVNVSAAAPMGSAVKFSSGNRHFSATLFEPSGQGPFPALVEVHGIYGQEHWDLEVSKQLAEAGYVTLAVDLFGRPARNYYDGLHLRDQVRPHVADDLRAAVSYLRSLKTVSEDRVGAIGWCMGGGYVLQLAIADPTLAAGVIYYGPLVVDEGQLARIHARMIGFFGREDRSIPIPAVRMFANGMRKAGNPLELHIYPDASHGFAQPEYRARGAYKPEQAAEAWEKTLQFLRVNLADQKGSSRH
jgi:carboxymethylenebutenolidase